MGADFIEQDVVLSKDGVAVILHDIHLESTTDVAVKHPERKRPDGRFYAIDFTLAELKSLAVTERRNTNDEPVYKARFPVVNSGLTLPTLDEEIRFISGLNQSLNRQVGWYIELKKPAFHTAEGYDIAKAVLDVLSRNDLNRADALVFLQCFDLNTLRYLREDLDTPLPLIMLIADNNWAEAPSMDYDWLRSDGGLDAIKTVANGIGPWIEQLSGQAGDYGNLVGRAKQRGLLVHPYTVRRDALPQVTSTLDELHEQLLIELAVDGVFSDFPDLTHKFITLNADTIKRARRKPLTGAQQP